MVYKIKPLGKYVISSHCLANMNTPRPNLASFFIMTRYISFYKNVILDLSMAEFSAGCLSESRSFHSFICRGSLLIQQILK